MRASHLIILVLAVVLLSALGACESDSVETPVALEEPLRVGYFIGSNSFPAQFFAGDLPAPTSGPVVAGVDVGDDQATPGKQGKKGYTVRLAKDAFAVAVRLAGRTNGYWIARVDQVDPLNGDQISASLFFDVAPDFATGNYQIELAGVDGDKQFGPRALAPLTIVPRYPAGSPVVITLKWDNAVDLDLQLRGPDGTLLSPKHPTTAPPGISDGGAVSGVGHIDGDSMASCVEDGLREEDIFFDSAPIRGNYGIFVNAFDLCKELGANYEVTVLRNGHIDQQYIGRVSAPEVQQGGFGLGDHIVDVQF